MFILGNFLKAIAIIIRAALEIYLWIIIARAILSWVSPDPYNSIVRLIHNLTEPVLGFLRRKLPLYFSGIDFSPIIVILIITFLKVFLVESLLNLSIIFLH